MANGRASGRVDAGKAKSIIGGKRLYSKIMTLTSTAIGFLLLSFGLAFCGARFFRAFQKIGGIRAGSRTGILLSLFFFGFAGVNGMLGLAGLFLIHSSEVFNNIVLISHLFLSATAILGAYIVAYIFLPSISPWLAMLPVCVSGILLIFFAFFDNSRPFIEEGGVINFDLSRTTSIFLSYVLFFGIGSAFVIFSHLFLGAKSHEVRIISLVMTITSFVAMVNTFIRYLLPPDIGVNFLRMGMYDAFHIATGVIFILLFALSPFILEPISRLWKPKTDNR